MTRVSGGRIGHKRGSHSTEALLLVPVLMLLTLMVVFAARRTDATFRVQRAADVAARVASRSAWNVMVSRGTVAARRDLALHAQSCRHADVDVRRVRRDDLTFVSATVSCVVNGDGLAFLSVPQIRVRASSTEVVDRYRSQ